MSFRIVTRIFHRGVALTNGHYQAGLFSNTSMIMTEMHSLAPAFCHACVSGLLLFVACTDLEHGFYLKSIVLPILIVALGLIWAVDAHEAAMHIIACCCPAGAVVLAVEKN